MQLQPPGFPKTYIVHVKGDETRKTYIDNELKRHHITGEFVLSGNQEDISTQDLENYFTGHMKTIKGQTSCAMKHILLYQKMVSEKIEIALVLEDDIELSRQFTSILMKTISETKTRGITNFLVSYDESDLRYVKGSLRKKGIFLYPETTMRTTGAYLVDAEGAFSILKQLETDKMDRPIDWYQDYCASLGKLNIYWCHPAIACQGSLNGKIRSYLVTKRFGLKKRIKYKFEKLYKKILFGLR